MSSLKNLARFAIVPVLGMLLSIAGGCGNGGSVSVDPEGGAKLKQARIAAYGPSGAPSGKPGAVQAQAQDTSGQAAARRKAQGNR
jgi:hypothetical protein